MIKTQNQFVQLNNGVNFPIMGMGTWETLTESDALTLKSSIIEGSYRHIDTASFYKNEELIGEILQEIFSTTHIKRSDVFVTTKVFMNETNDIKAAIKQSLSKLKLDYVDLYLIHWPIQITGTRTDPILTKIPLHKQWAEMEELVHLGLAKSIGVSNFNYQLLCDLLSYAKIRPATNQIELHPYLVQYDFVEWLKSEHIPPTAYSPLAKGIPKTGKEPHPMTDPVIQKMATKYKVGEGKIILAWHRMRGHIVIPKTAKFERALENLSSLDLVLENDEIEEINKLSQNMRTVSPKNWGAPFNKIPLWD